MELAVCCYFLVSMSEQVVGAENDMVRYTDVLTSDYRMAGVHYVKNTLRKEDLCNISW